MRLYRSRHRRRPLHGKPRVWGGVHGSLPGGSFPSRPGSRGKRFKFPRRPKTGFGAFGAWKNTSDDKKIWYFRHFCEHYLVTSTIITKHKTSCIIICRWYTVKTVVNFFAIFWEAQAPLTKPIYATNWNTLQHRLRTKASAFYYLW